MALFLSDGGCDVRGLGDGMGGDEDARVGEILGFYFLYKGLGKSSELRDAVT